MNVARLEEGARIAGRSLAEDCNVYVIMFEVDRGAKEGTAERRGQLISGFE